MMIFVFGYEFPKQVDHSTTVYPDTAFNKNLFETFKLQ